MKKKWTALALCGAMLLPLCGCLFRSPEQLYRQPEKSAGYEQLNSAIRQVRTGLGGEFGSDVSDVGIQAGDNTASIQLQDLDGDGTRESALTFLRLPEGEKPLRIYVFTQVGEEYVVTGVVEGEGSGIYAIDYEQLNGGGRKELVVLWQISTGAYQLGVYTLDDVPLPDPEADKGQLVQYRQQTQGKLLGQELLLSRCSVAADGTSGGRLVDMDQDTRKEIAVVRLDTGEAGSSVEVYGWQDGAMTSLATAALSKGIARIDRIRTNYLAGEYLAPALYITSTLTDERRVIDVVAYQDQVLTDLALDPDGVSREILSGYTEVTPTDINADNVVELPSPSPLPSYGQALSANFWLLDWSQYDQRGHRNHVLTTYHNVSDGWYLEIPENWWDQIAISRNDQVTGRREVIFSRWRGEDVPPEPFLSIYRLSSSRSAEVTENGWFPLREEENVIYAARFHPNGWNCGLDEMDLLERFKTIQTSWYYE